MDTDFNIFWQLGWQKKRNTNTQVDLHAIFNLFCSSFDNLEFRFFWFTQLFTSDRLFSDREFLDDFLWINTGWVLKINSVNIYTRNVNMFWWNLTVLNQFLDFSDHNLGSSGHIGVEISCSLCKVQVSCSVSFLSVDQSKITENGFFLNESFSLEDFVWFNFWQNLWLSCTFFKLNYIFSCLNIRIGSSFSVKCWNSCTSWSDFFSQSSLGCEFYFNFSV